MRLIDADELMKNRYYAKWFSPEMLVIGEKYIMDSPTIKSCTNKGKWIYIKPNNAYEPTYPCCSECNSFALQSGGYPCIIDYCPNCGANLKDGTDSSK